MADNKVIGSLAGLAFTIILVTIALFVTGQITQGIQDINTTSIYNVTNESITGVIDFNISINNFNIDNATFTASYVDGNLPNSDFHVTEANGSGQFQLLNTTANATAINISYNFTNANLDASHNISADGQTGLLQISGQLGLYGLVAVMAVVIALVIGFTKFGSGNA